MPMNISYARGKDKDSVLVKTLLNITTMTQYTRQITHAQHILVRNTI